MHRSEKNLGGQQEAKMSKNETTARTSTESVTTHSDVDAFLAQMTKSSASGISASGRLVFALDATASRRETWDMACQLQGDMFRSVAAIGGLSIQLVYYRDLSECRTSRWVTDPNHLAQLMTRIDCRAGRTQIAKVLAHAKRETALLKVSALIFVGDACEESEDELLPDAHELGRLGVPVFMFQEGNKRDVEQVFRAIARATHGAYCRFDEGSARQLGELLKAVAVFAVGGMAALAARKDAGAIKLLGQMRGGARS
jgi:hypothetical protein